MYTNCNYQQKSSEISTVILKNKSKKTWFIVKYEASSGRVFTSITRSKYN